MAIRNKILLKFCVLIIFVCFMFKYRDFELNKVIGNSKREKEDIINDVTFTEKETFAPSDTTTLMLEGTETNFVIEQEITYDYVNELWRSVLRGKGKFPQIFIHYRSWLDTRVTVFDTPCIRTSFVYEKDIYKNFIYHDFNNLKINHTGSIMYNNTMYNLKGRVMEYNNEKCRKILEFEYCRQVISFSIPFNASHEDFQNNLERKFTYKASNFQDKQNEIEINIPNKTAQKNDFFVCSKPMWGRMSDSGVKFLVEWVEMLKLMGVHRINLYNLTMEITPAMGKFLNYYEEQGTVTMTQFKHPLHEELGRHPEDSHIDKVLAYYSDPAGLNDCFFKNMHNYRYLIVLDTDEFPVPMQHNDYNSLMDDLSKQGLTQKTISLANSWCYFYNKTDHSERSTIFSYKEYYNTPGRGKSFTRTDLCPYTGQHSCAVPNGDNEKIVRLPYNISKTHHYRNGCKMLYMCQPDAEILEADHMDRFKPALKDKLNKIYNLFGI